MKNSKKIMLSLVAGLVVGNIVMSMQVGPGAQNPCWLTEDCNTEAATPNVMDQAVKQKAMTPVQKLKAQEQYFFTNIKAVQQASVNLLQKNIQMLSHAGVDSQQILKLMEDFLKDERVVYQKLFTQIQSASKLVKNQYVG